MVSLTLTAGAGACRVPRGWHRLYDCYVLLASLSTRRSVLSERPEDAPRKSTEAASDIRTTDATQTAKMLRPDIQTQRDVQRRRLRVIFTPSTHFTPFTPLPPYRDSRDPSKKYHNSPHIHEIINNDTAIITYLSCSFTNIWSLYLALTLHPSIR